MLALLRLSFPSAAFLSSQVTCLWHSTLTAWTCMGCKGGNRLLHSPGTRTQHYQSCLPLRACDIIKSSPEAMDALSCAMPGSAKGLAAFLGPDLCAFSNLINNGNEPTAGSGKEPLEPDVSDIATGLLCVLWPSSVCDPLTLRSTFHSASR